jgi:pectinesterase inhibitor-like protein
MKRSVQLTLFVLLSYQLLSLATGFGFTTSSHGSQVTSFCGQTHDPRLCMAATKRFSTSYPAAINAQAVLRMHLGAISKRCFSAKKRALRLAQRGRGPSMAALKSCAGLYSNAVDLIGVSMRALNANDGQTAQMVQIMLQEVRQSAQECDMKFQRPGVSNPLAHASGSIVKMTVNADDLNNMMTRTSFHKS